MDVIVALMFDNSFGTARFLQVKLKASRTRVYALVLYKNAFPNIGSRPAASTLGLRHSCVPMAASQQSRSGSENDAKIQNF